MRLQRLSGAVVMAIALCLAPCLATAQDIAIEPPAEGAFVQDLAQMVKSDDVLAIREIGEQLLSDLAIPIIVVTVDSMGQYGGSNWRIETFARILFDQWGIGHETIEGESWNRGILLVVSKNDRKARIELGADWAGEYDATCREIMDGQIIANFKQGNFSGGILAGVQALDNMSRGLEMPKPVQPPWFWPVTIGVIALAIFSAVSLARSGASGWAWILWAAIFGIIGMILYQMATSSGRGGGGFSGGSFGGGFGGGGGATGSW
jgi:uncharacterized protein